MLGWSPSQSTPPAQLRRSDRASDAICGRQHRRRRRSLDQRAREVKAPYPDAVSLLALLLLRRPVLLIPSSLNKHIPITHAAARAYVAKSCARALNAHKTRQNPSLDFCVGLQKIGSDRKCEIWRSQDVCARDTSHYEQRTKTVRAEDIAN